MESPTVATCPFAGGRRVTRGMRVPRKEYARNRHQRLFEENVEKTEGKPVKKKILSSGVVFTLEEGISISHVCLKGQQPLIECANMTLFFTLPSEPICRFGTIFVEGLFA